MTQGSGSQQVEATAAQAATAAPAQGAAASNVVTSATLTRQDVAALRARAEELSRQITSATERREKTREDMRSATGSDRAGLEQRLAVLDNRIVRLEQEIDQNSAQLASIPARMAVAGRQPDGPRPPSQNFNRLVDSMVPIVIVFTIFVLTPIALSISRYFWKKGSLPKVAPASAENNQRLERMEQALDSIAIEVERVSEGQRFVTRLMAEGRPGLAEGQRAAAPIPVSVGEGAGLPRY